MRRRVRGTGQWQQWANDGIDAVNGLYGASTPSASPTPLQQHSLDRLVATYREMGRPPSDISSAGAFAELCGTKVPYLDEGSGVQPYQRDLVSLPATGGSATTITDFLEPVHCERLVGPNSSLLRPESELESAFLKAGVCTPHCDPSFNSPRVYGTFLRDLHEQGLITLYPSGAPSLASSLWPKRMVGFA